MNIEVGKAYVDRHGTPWLVHEISPHDPFAPVRAHRWGDRFLTRHFQLDGRYWKSRPDPWDLVAPATQEETT